MRGLFDNDEYNEEPGCYVDGWRGWHGLAHLVLWQFPGFATTQEQRLIRAYDRGWQIGGLIEVSSDIGRDVEDRINAALPDGLVAYWSDGFHISTLCEDETTCADDECAHWAFA